MINDLTKFEKDLLRSINLFNSKNYTHKSFMEWSTDKSVVEKNMLEGELLYEAFNCWVVINPSIK
jgi:hypothetical protein